MLRIKKNCSILAALFFCAQVFLACTEPNPSLPIEVTGFQTIPADSVSSSAIKDSTDFNTTQKEAVKPDTTAKDSTKFDTPKKDTTELHTNSEDGDVIRTCILGDSTGELYSGKLYLDYPADSFLTKFELGDIVTVAIDGYDTLEMPVAESSGDVPIAWFMVSAISGSENVLLTIHNGLLSDALRIKDLTRPIKVTISMKEKGGFLFGLEMRYAQYMDYYIENYPELSVEEFANFREVRTTGMGKNKLYRSSSPIDNCLGRNLKADSLAKEAGVATFINLADSEESAKSFKGFDSSYYSSQNAIFLAMPVEFFTRSFQKRLVKGFRFMIEHDGPYLVHCTYGMDRTGFTISVLEALMGATSEDIQADYAKTFSNYYNVVEGRQVPLNEQQVDFFKNVVTRNLQAVYHAERIEVPDIDNADWATATEKYLRVLGMTPEEVAALKSKLK